MRVAELPLGADASVLPQLRRAPDGKAEALFLDSVVPGVTLAEGVLTGWLPGYLLLNGLLT